MKELSELAYVTVGVKDFESWREFATQMIGLEVSEESADEMLLRHDIYNYRIRTVRDDRDDLLAVGWRVCDRKVLEDVAARLRAGGATVECMTDIEHRQRRIGGGMWLADPDGNRVEIVHGLQVSHPAPFQSPLRISGFVTDEEGMGHIGVWTDNLEGMEDFYRNVLGLRVVDRVESSKLRAVFLRCNTRQHSLAIIQRFAPGTPAKCLHHIELELKSRADLGRAYDRAQDRQIVMITLGEHPAEQAMSFYMWTPAGFGFELSWEGVRVQEDAGPETWHDDTPLWGHKFVPPPAERHKVPHIPTN